VAIRIVDLNGRDVGPSVNRPEENASALRDGWYHTGDLAMLDANGYVFIIDRIKDVIISGGYNIAPKEVEDVLISHPLVLEAAVIGVPEAALGEVVTAHVVLKQGASCSADELLGFCRERLAAYKLPRSVVFRDQLPKTPSGKLKRYELREAADRRG
jgi:long-chain acyl-CoA synthetase